MKAYDLKPTHDNLIQTLTEDTIDRNQDISHFVSILNAVEDGCAIALDGRWGSGKTFFIKQAKMVLEAYNPNIQSMPPEERQRIQDIFSKFSKEETDLIPQVCVYYDAWENDNDDDPVLSLVYTILSSVKSDFTFKNTSCINIATSILEFFTGKNWGQIISSFKSDNPLDVIGHSKNIEELVKEFLDSLLPERGNRLVIFIDELDRCKPSYAVRLLERMKHYFTNERITFVFSVNIAELQHTVKKHYGNDFDGSRYLDRFFDLRVALPPANIQKFYWSMDFNDTHYTFDIVCGAVIKAYHFELREIAKYIRLTRMAAAAPTHDNRHLIGGSLQFALLYIIPIMIGLKISDIQRYDRFVSGQDYTPLLKVSDALRFAFFGDLLNRNETFDETDDGKTVVTLEDKLRDVYIAIFGNVDFQSNDYTQIGNLTFNHGMKEKLLRTDGLFSSYTSIT